jgi:predicted ArsR family transcriptional regulator
MMTAAYDDLAGQALSFIAETAGPEAVQRFAERRAGRLQARYGPRVDGAGPDPKRRAAALADALTGDGYAASVRPVAETAAGPSAGTQLCQGHCPVQHVAAEFPQLCEAETEAFSRLLGVHVQRLATLAHGEHVCTTYIPAGSIPAGAPPHAGIRPAGRTTTSPEGTPL